MRHISRQGLDLICRFEGFSPIIYMCPAGYPTIGYGHLITEANKEQFLDGVDEDEALDLLRKDVAVAERAVLRLISVPLTQGQFDALVSFTYNLGAQSLSTSTLLRKLNAGDYAGAADEFLRWNKAGGKVLTGLTRRREAERDLFLS